MCCSDYTGAEIERQTPDLVHSTLARPDGEFDPPVDGRRPDDYNSHQGVSTVRKTVGVREAKARLSQLLREVQRGDSWTITDHGRPVARLGSAEESDLSLTERLQRLKDRGWIVPLDHEPLPLPPPLPLEQGTASRWLEEDRDHAT